MRLGLRRLWALMRKEWLQIGRDPSALAIAFVFVKGFGTSLAQQRGEQR